MTPLSEVYLKQLQAICTEFSKGYEITCPKCGGYAIVNQSAGKTIRIRCTQCYIDIRKEVII